MKLNWTKRFLRDLNEAAAYIADDDPDAADRWLDRVEEAVQRLCDFPWSGRNISDSSANEYRSLVIGNYRVLYVVEEDAVALLYLRHGARRLPWEAEDE